MRLAKLRWRIERDYQEMTGELGLDHFEGRTWQGYHHHAALCAAAHAFLALRRALSPRRRIPWTVALVRRYLQPLLLRKLPSCPLCGRAITHDQLPRTHSRM